MLVKKITKGAMKKIMFSTEYGLEQAVLAGTKTQTRRIMIPTKKFKGNEDLMLEYHRRPSAYNL